MIEDLTDPKQNPLVPTGEGEIDPILTSEGNELIPPDAYPGRPAAAPLVEVPEKPSVEFVEKVLAKFFETSNAADLEKVKASLGL